VRKPRISPANAALIKDLGINGRRQILLDYEAVLKSRGSIPVLRDIIRTWKKNGAYFGKVHALSRLQSAAQPGHQKLQNKFILTAVFKAVQQVIKNAKEKT